jgi:hypothetical protein
MRLHAGLPEPGDGHLGGDSEMLDRRQFLSATALAGAMTGLGGLAWPAAGVTQTAPISTNARIVIVGAGAAGTALANRLSRRLEGAAITIIDPRPQHFYQPGLTLSRRWLETCRLCRLPDDRLASQWCDSDRGSRGGG